MVLGAAVETQKQLPTFDELIHDIGFGLFPWSAVVPFAVGRLLRPPHGVRGREAARETALRVVLLLTATTAFGAYSMLAPTVGVQPR